MNFFIISIIKNLLVNEIILPAFEETVSQLFRSELEKTITNFLNMNRRFFLIMNVMFVVKILIFVMVFISVNLIPNMLF